MQESEIKWAVWRAGAYEMRDCDSVSKVSLGNGNVSGVIAPTAGSQRTKGCTLSASRPLNERPVTELFVPTNRNFPVFCSGTVLRPEARRRSIHDPSTCDQLGERWGREEGLLSQPPVVLWGTEKVHFVSRPFFPSAARLSQT